MQKKFTISHFTETRVRPPVLTPNLNAAYQQMAQDERRETEAWEWAEATLGDVGEEPISAQKEAEHEPGLDSACCSFLRCRTMLGG